MVIHMARAMEAARPEQTRLGLLHALTMSGWFYNSTMFKLLHVLGNLEANMFLIM